MDDFVGRVARAAGVPENLVGVLGLILAGLAVGSVVRTVRLSRAGAGPEEWRARTGSLAVWWVLFALLAAVVLAGKGAAAVLFAAVGLLGLLEFRDVERAKDPVMRHWWLTYLAVPAHYLIVYFGWDGGFWAFVPAWVLFILVVRLVASGEPAGFLETAGVAFLGLMLTVLLPSHAVRIFALPPGLNPGAGPVGLFVYLLVLTEVNDIAQALWGRRFGRRKITPRVSPGKTWEGFLLGATTTVVLALLLAPLLTPFAAGPARLGTAGWDVPYLPALAAGLLIAVGGFLGDITMSTIKREVGVKDSGTLLPGQGGVLDRLDSLTFTAPLFYYFTRLLYG
ncbi:MAG TPA: phosphatidate cytidylyltransferase [Gemmataceae bacterium]